MGLTRRRDRPHARDRALIGIDHHPHVTAFGIKRHHLVGRPAPRWRAQRRQAGGAYDPRNAPRCHAGHEVALTVVASRAIVVSLCGCGPAAGKAERGNRDQKCDRFFQGTLLSTVVRSAARAKT